MARQDDDDDEYTYIYTNFVEHNRHFLSTFFSSGSVPYAVLLLSYSVGIDLCIVHSCIYPKFFLPDIGPPSGEDLFIETYLKANDILSNGKDAFA